MKQSLEPTEHCSVSAVRAEDGLTRGLLLGAPRDSLSSSPVLRFVRRQQRERGQRPF